MNLPNALSILRILSVPVFIWSIFKGHLEVAFWLFLAAGISDGLDGYIAKRFEMQTELGAFLDPIADKLLLVSAFISLTMVDLIPLWLTLIVVSRDILIVAGALLYQVLTGHLEMEPLAVSKVNTVLQIFLVLAVLALEDYGLMAELIGPASWTVALTTIISGLAYIAEWTRRATRDEGQEFE